MHFYFSGFGVRKIHGIESKLIWTDVMFPYIVLLVFNFTLAMRFFETLFRNLPHQLAMF
jgi:hypothetical protein